MNKKITFFGLSLVALVGLFAGAGVASASSQGVITTCTSATFNGSVTPNGQATEVWFEWGTNTSLAHATAHQTFTVNSNFSQLVSGLTANTTYYYRAVASNSAGTARGGTISFRTPVCATVASAPSATTNNATSILTDRAALNGYINPNGTSDTTYWFEWGTSSSLGNATQHYSKGAAASNTTVTITGLTQNTTYYYRANAQNAQGIVHGSIVSFTTAYVNNNTNNTTASLPSATTNNATSILTDRAALNGYINPNGTSDTTYWFEWGTSSSLGNATQHYSKGAAASNTTVTITGLTQNTTYYYRANAQNAQGIVHGSIVSFTTAYVNNNTNTVANTTSNPTVAVTCNSATLNGAVVTNGISTEVWFEWGTSSSLGSATQHQTFTTNSNFSQIVSGLAPSTLYYYRAVASNSAGTAQGNILSFSTTACSIPASQSAPTVTTNSATNTSVDFAVLNGYVNPNGTNDTAYWFEWGTSTGLGNQTAHYSQGASASNISATLSGLTSNTTYYYRATAQNTQGVVYGSIISFTTGVSNTCGTSCNSTIATVSTRNADTSSDYAVLNGYVDPNGTSNTVRWFEWGSSISLGNSTQRLSQGSYASNFSATLTGLVSNTTYYYRAAALNSSGTVYGSILSFTTGYTDTRTINVVSVAPTATTLFATELTSANAKLNGLVFTSATQPSSAWFEWGTNSSLGNKTQTFSVGTAPTIKHSNFINGLTSGQTYYYRIVAENSYGKNYGSIMSFVSERATVVPDTTVILNTPVRTNTVRTTTIINRGSSAQSLVALALDGGAEVIVSGEKRGYHVTWKNESTQSLKNVVLRVTLPPSMNFESATNGSYSSADNTVTVDLKTLAPKQDGELFVFAVANRKLTQGQLVVVTANMVYTDTQGVQGDAIAYATHRGEQAQNSFGANLFGAGSFLPTSLFEWILLLILVLILVLLGNHLYGRFSDEK